jgi:hypothetical protein
MISEIAAEMNLHVTARSACKSLDCLAFPDHTEASREMRRNVRALARGIYSEAKREVAESGTRRRFEAFSPPRVGEVRIRSFRSRPQPSSSSKRLAHRCVSLAVKQHPNMKPGAGFDLFCKIDFSRFRPWDPEKDPQPIYRDDLLKADATGGDDADGETDEADENGREFAYESDMRDYLAQYLNALEEGLRL